MTIKTIEGCTVWDKRLELAVGLFVVASVLALAFLAFRVSGLVIGDSGATYRIYADFADASGLANRSKISIAGVTVGRVAAIELDSQTQRATVSMDIDQSVDFLTTDTSARILTAGLLGEKYIELASGADDTTLADGDFILDTQSSLVLENLIGKFLSNSSSSQ